MKWLFLPLLWLLAAVLAVWVSWRVWRGRPVVLRGRLAPLVVRLAVLFLLLFGAGVDGQAEAAPVPDTSKGAGEELPPSVNETVVARWLQLRSPSGPWAQLKLELTLPAPGAKTTKAPAPQRDLRILPARFRALVEADLKARAEGQPPAAVAPAELLAALDEMEANGFYDHWLNAYLWRRSAGAGAPRERAELYARLHRHARVTDALIKAYFVVRPITAEPLAWRSKAGPKAADLEAMQRYRVSLADMVKTTRSVYPGIDGGTWRRDGLAVFKVVKGGAALTWRHDGRKSAVPDGETLRFGRLDLLEADGKEVVLEHAWLGTLTLPAGQAVTVWELPRLLSEDGRKKVRQAVQAALEGDEKAAERLEEALPLAQADLRAALAESAAAKGAPRLRLILTLFDDAVMPALPDPPPEKPLPK